MHKFISGNKNSALFVCAALAASLATARADYQENKILLLTQPPGYDQAEAGGASEPTTIEIQTVEPDSKKPKHQVAWLGLAVSEASEALSSQLGLKPGQGLTVDFLAAGSPATKADFRKNDVLVELDGQMLVHPIQFRKLVQMHAEGDSVNVVFYRAGKKQTATVKLGKTDWGEAHNQEDRDAAEKLQRLESQINGLNSTLSGVSDSLRSSLDKARIDADIRRTMEQTRKAIRDAIQSRASEDHKTLREADRELESLARHGIDVEPDATVIVRNTHNSNRTMVQTDESGSYVLEAGDKTHLIARSQTGKLLFDGEIDTAAERDKVPKAVWEKVESMYDQFALPEDGKLKKDSSQPGP
jgi:hypothetical protein